MEHHGNELLDWGTAGTGGLLAVADGGFGMVTAVGIAIGLVGALCGLSREARAWLDRREARRLHRHPHR